MCMQCLVFCGPLVVCVYLKSVWKKKKKREREREREGGRERERDGLVETTETISDMYHVM